MPSTYWIAFGDTHNSTARLAGIDGLEKAEGIMLTGDLTFAGGTDAAQKVLDAISAKGRLVAAQIGNMDKPDVNELLQRRNINLHGQAVKLHPSVTAIGVGGSSKTPFSTPSEFSEEQIAALLEQALAQAGEYDKLILVAHTPPFETECDKLSGGGHAGSKAVREFIERVQPDLCLCGHIHEARSMDMIANTPVINPGAFADGGYVRVSLEDGELESALLTAK